MSPARVLWGPRRWLFLYAFVVGLDDSCLPEGTLHHYTTRYFNSAGSGSANSISGPLLVSHIIYALLPPGRVSLRHTLTWTSLSISTFIRNRTGIQSTPDSAISNSKAPRGPCSRLSKRPGRKIPKVTTPTSTREEGVD